MRFLSQIHNANCPLSCQFFPSQRINEKTNRYYIQKIAV